MKLESLKGRKFEQLSDEAMAFIVGGADTRCSGGQIDTAAGCVKISNDYIDGGGVMHWSEGPGNDMSQKMLDRACGEEFTGVEDTEDPLYNEWIRMQIGTPCEHHAS